MKDILLVGAGGFAGSVARYLLGGWVTQLSGASRFPFGTLAVNAAGCLIIGALAGAAEHGGWLTPGARLLLFTGVLGGFTTFSAFGFETFFLAREQMWSAALLSVALHLLVALPLVWVGFRLAAVLSR